MEIVVNSSPLILLAKIGRLALLGCVASKVYIPCAVMDEVRGLDLREVPHSLLRVSNRQLVISMLGALHLGEVEVIVGAMESGVRDVVLDDSLARKRARELGLCVSGTLGVLRRARNMGFISDLEREIMLLRANGMYISDELVRKALL